MRDKCEGATEVKEQEEWQREKRPGKGKGRQVTTERS